MPLVKVLQPSGFNKVGDIINYRGNDLDELLTTDKVEIYGLATPAQVPVQEGEILEGEAIEAPITVVEAEIEGA
jgi:hypothetical protein